MPPPRQRRRFLRNGTLRWTAPELFNDPFEFKSPFELGFEWEDVEKPFFDEISRIIIQPEPPTFHGSPAAFIIRAARTMYKGGDPADIVQKLRPGFPNTLDYWKKQAESERQTWSDMKRQYRVLCFSAVPNDILMWSHYAENHKGAVLAFQPKLELDTSLLRARPVFYSREVPNGGSLAEFVKYVTGQWPHPNREGAFEKSVFTKSVVWVYENEWRILDKGTTMGAQLYSDRPFEPGELVAIYFGCRATQESTDKIIEAARSLRTPISFFQMRDERIRFELTPVLLKI